MSTKVSGNISHLPPSQLRLVERLFRRKLDPTDLIHREFAAELYSVARAIKRRVGVLVNRDGQIVEVFVGSREILYLPDLGRYRVAGERFRRLRLLFSDLSKSPVAEIPRDVYTDLEKLRLDAVCSVKESSGRISLSWAYVMPYRAGSQVHVHTETVRDIADLQLDFARFISDLEDEHAQSTVTGTRLDDGALLVGVYAAGQEEAAASMAELRELVRTAGVKICGEYMQRRKPDPRTLVGSGKIEELVLEALRLGAEMIIFDTELRPSQWRAITNATELKVLDRSMVILDIFAQRATSSDGRLQVELAQLKYNLPRLVEKDAGLSRLVGGIGGRGPGETKLEIGRRRIRERITRLEKQIDTLSQQRDVRRGRRSRKGIPVVSILGYTNAGKSTLFNQLTNSLVLAEDKLFATLDTNQAKIAVPVGELAGVPGDYPAAFAPVVLADTVGFIRDLPETLMNAFRATLEELHDASILLHVLDASDVRIAEKNGSVMGVLRELDLLETPRITVLNKIDLVSRERRLELGHEYGAIQLSALEKTGFEELRREIGLAIGRLPGGEGKSVHIKNQQIN